VNAKRVALTSTFTALAVALRLAKHALVGPLQFVNFPLSIAMVAAFIGGSWVGAAVGAFSFVASDLLIWLGPWTPVNALLAAAIGWLWGFAARSFRSGITLFVFAYLSAFAYDLLSSVLGYLIYLPSAGSALALALIGLFLPVSGGWLIGVGPVTEFITAALTAAAIEILQRVLPQLATTRATQL
jgi:energy-coupling factor transport system substrate-specific component